MGLCRTCREFLPPDFMNENKECEFCKQGTNIIITPSNEMFRKEDVVLDYKILLGNLKEAQNVKSLFVNSVVKKEGLLFGKTQ